MPRVTREHRPAFSISVMRALIAVALLLATCACGAYQFPGASPAPSPGGGNVSGRALAVPCAPVEKAGSTCAGRPVPKLELDYVKGDAVAASTVTDSGGSYVVSLAAGTYVVSLKTYMRVISGPLTLTVGPGSSLVANYILDSGIRVPLPQQ
jgi:hypothetical protein